MTLLLPGKAPAPVVRRALESNDDLRNKIKELEDKYSTLYSQQDELMDSYNQRANDVARYRDLYHEAVAERITREQLMKAKFKAAMTLGNAAKKRAKKAEKERSDLQERLDWYTTTYGALYSPAPTMSSPSVSDIGMSDTAEY